MYPIWLSRLDENIQKKDGLIVTCIRDRQINIQAQYRQTDIQARYIYIGIEIERNSKIKVK